MSPGAGGRRRRLGVLAAAAVLAVGLPAGRVTAGILGKADAQKLAAYRAAGEAQVSVAVVSVPGRGAATAARVAAMGGRVRFSDPETDFASVVLPLDAAARLAHLDTVEAVSVDWFPDFSGRFQAQPPPAPAATPAALAGPSPLEQPYDFARDLDAEGARAAGRDGRGVLVAHVELFPDFLAPELKSALDADGRPVRKFQDVVNLPDWEADSDAPGGPEAWRWVKLGPVLLARDGRIEAGGVSYKVPAGTGFRLGRLAMPRWRVQDLGLPASFPAEAAVLWSDASGEARVDGDGDHDFTDDAPVAPFAASHRFGVLGRDDPATPRRESLGYALEKQGDWLSFDLGDDSHATMVVGELAARRGEAGRVDGVAPGSQVLEIYGGSTVSTLARALIRAFRSDADVVLYETYFPVVDIDELKEGRTAIELLISRLVERFRKPIVIPAGNAAGLATIGDPSPEAAIVVGAAQSRGATLLAYGVEMDRPFGQHWASSEGPTGSGGFKPDILAPVNNLTLRSGFLAGAERKGRYVLPPGYGIGNGTSAAAPVAAGAVAVLIGAARQSGFAPAPEAVKSALQAGARPLDDLAPYQQGAGVLRIDTAWDQLSRASGRPPLRLRLRAPVETADSAHFETPDTGTGLFLERGLRAGQETRRTLTVTRTSGSPGALEFALRWSGTGAGAFSGPAEIALPLGRPVTVAVRIRPAPGVNSAVLELSRGGVVQARVSAVAVAPQELAASDGYAASAQVEVPAQGRRSLFFRVPPGMDALVLRGRYGEGQVMGSIASPDGGWEGGLAFLALDPANGDGARAIERPAPGVWRVTLNSVAGRFEGPTHADTPPPALTTAEISASVVRTSVKAGPARVAARNLAAPLEGVLKAAPLIGLRRDQGVLQAGADRMFDVEVGKGARLLLAEVGAARDFDLYLFDCTSGACDLHPYRRAVSFDGHERVLVEAPKPGRWRVVLHAGFDRGQAAYRYFQAVAGEATPLEAAARRPRGAAWSAPAKSGPMLYYVEDERLRAFHGFKVKPPATLIPSDDDLVPLGLQLAEPR